MFGFVCPKKDTRRDKDTNKQTDKHRKQNKTKDQKVTRTSEVLRDEVYWGVVTEGRGAPINLGLGN